MTERQRFTLVNDRVEADPRLRDQRDKLTYQSWRRMVHLLEQAAKQAQQGR